jgi:hypothetical protein
MIEEEIIGLIRQMVHEGLIKEARICNTISITKKKEESVKEVFLFEDDTNCGRRILDTCWERIKERLLRIVRTEEKKGGEKDENTAY